MDLRCFAGFGQDLPAVDYAIENQETLGLNDSFMADLIEVAKENGLYEFTERNLKFPPEGHVYAPEEFSADFQPWATVYYYTNLTNPCFDVYQIEYKCPVPADPLGFSPVSQVSSRHNYLNDQKGVVRSSSFSGRSECKLTALCVAESSPTCS